MAKKIVKVSSFPYTGSDGVERTALRGDEVDISTAVDLERGERLDAFATEADLEETTVFGVFYSQLQQRRSVEDEPVATQPDPVVAGKKPAAGTPRKDA